MRQREIDKINKLKEQARIKVREAENKRRSTKKERKKKEYSMDAVIKVILKEYGPLPIDEIVKKTLTGFETKSQNPKRIISVHLTRNKQTYKKISRGVYSLNEEEQIQ